MQETSSATASQKTIPTYGENPTKPGLYLGLFHGRNDPDQRMDGWGFNGPTIGPLEWCHTTYASDIKIEFVSASDALRYFKCEDCQQVLGIHGDMLVYDGKYFGDWTVYYIAARDCCPPADTFRNKRRTSYRIAHNPIPS